MRQATEDKPAGAADESRQVLLEKIRGTEGGEVETPRGRDEDDEPREGDGDRGTGRFGCGGILDSHGSSLLVSAVVSGSEFAVLHPETF
jgi:hypothetical protein